MKLLGDDSMTKEELKIKMRKEKDKAYQKKTEERREDTKSKEKISKLLIGLCGISNEVSTFFIL